MQIKKERFACLSKLRQTNRPFFAESEGFEPPEQFNRSPHFECGTIDHSVNSPFRTRYFLGFTDLIPL